MALLRFTLRFGPFSPQLEALGAGFYTGPPGRNSQPASQPVLNCILPCKEPVSTAVLSVSRLSALTPTLSKRLALLVSRRAAPATMRPYAVLPTLATLATSRDLSFSFATLY